MRASRTPVRHQVHTLARGRLLPRPPGGWNMAFPHEEGGPSCLSIAYWPRQSLYWLGCGGSLASHRTISRAHCFSLCNMLITSGAVSPSPDGRVAAQLSLQMLQSLGWLVGIFRQPSTSLKGTPERLCHWFHDTHSILSSSNRFTARAFLAQDL